MTVETLKTALFAIALLASWPAQADAVDDYVACLIGRSAVALGQQKNAEQAQEIAYGLCKEPTDYGDAEPDGVSDYVNLMVERMATE